MQRLRWLDERALEEIVAIASHQEAPRYAGLIGDHDLFRQQFSLNEAAYQAARGYNISCFPGSRGIGRRRRNSRRAQRARLRQATTWLHQTADAVVHFCHLWAGSEVFQRHTPISRVSRDMAVATQHIYVDPLTLIDAAPAIMATWQR